MNNNNNDVFGEVLEKGQQAGQKTAAAISDAAKMAAGQVTGGDSKNDTAQSQDAQASQAEEVKGVVKDFYAPSQNSGQPPLSKEQIEEADRAKIAQVKQQLHNEVYYDPLVKRSEETQAQEERPAERVEREEMEDLQLEQKKAKEKPDYAMQREQRRAEVKGGVSG